MSFSRRGGRYLFSRRAAEDAEVALRIFKEERVERYGMYLEAHRRIFYCVKKFFVSVYGRVAVVVVQHFIWYIDDAPYVFGASLKDAGKRLFAYIRMQETSAPELLNAVR